MAIHQHETHIVERGGSGGIIGGIAIVALLVVAFILFFNWNGTTGGGTTVDLDVPAVSVDVQPDGQ